MVKAGGNQGDAEGLAEAFVSTVAPDDVGVVAASILGDFKNLVHLVQRHFVGA